MTLVTYIYRGDLNCATAPGYLWSRPVPADQITALCTIATLTPV